MVDETSNGEQLYVSHSNELFYRTQVLFNGETDAIVFSFSFGLLAYEHKSTEIPKLVFITWCVLDQNQVRMFLTLLYERPGSLFF